MKNDDPKARIWFVTTLFVLGVLAILVLSIYATNAGEPIGCGVKAYP